MQDKEKWLKLITLLLEKRKHVDGLKSDFQFSFNELDGVYIDQDERIRMLNLLCKDEVMEKYKINDDTITVIGCSTKNLENYLLETKLVKSLNTNGKQKVYISETDGVYMDSTNKSPRYGARKKRMRILICLIENENLSGSNLLENTAYSSINSLSRSIKEINYHCTKYLKLKHELIIKPGCGGYALNHNKYKIVHT